MNQLHYQLQLILKESLVVLYWFLRYDVTNSGIITAYNTKGKFSIGEKLIFNGIENNRISTAVNKLFYK
jgi:hypothetical protein